MGAVRFLEVELHYGCHDGVHFTLPTGRDPVVLGGPNGAGKTTLVEALARAPFGFNRRVAEDNLVLEARRPWGGEHCRVRVVFTAADGSRWAVERDFATAAVGLEPLDGGG
ncbi:MAG: AAA family ATPase, partial [Gemmatimonadota bacterium]